MIVALLVGLVAGHASAQQIVDYTAIREDAFAQRLGLSDQQSVEVKKILDQRRAAIIAAKPDQREQVFADANEKLSAILSDSQRTKFAELVSGGNLRFAFNNEAWPDVLQWFAGQADLALVMNEAPPDAFTYTDTKNHTPTEAIDLLNSVLQTKGFTLVRRDKMLIVSRTTEGVPYDQVPRVQPHELNDRGQFEYVSVLFPLDGRPVESVHKEVTAFLGENGRATSLPATKQLMVVDTAGRAESIRKLIESIPKPKAKKKEQTKPKPKAKPKPPPIFKVHSTSGLNVEKAIETLKQLYGDIKITGDAKAEQITAFTPEDKHKAIAKTLAQMTQNVTGDNEPRLHIYSIVDADQDLGQLKEVLAQANPGVQVSTDEDGSRLLVVADVQQHGRSASDARDTRRS